MGLTERETVSTDFFLFSGRIFDNEVELMKPASSYMAPKNTRVIQNLTSQSSKNLKICRVRELDVYIPLGSK